MSFRYHWKPQKKLVILIFALISFKKYSHFMFISLNLNRNLQSLIEIFRLPVVNSVGSLIRGQSNLCAAESCCAIDMGKHWGFPQLPCDTIAHNCYLLSHFLAVYIIRSRLLLFRGYENKHREFFAKHQ